MRARVYFWALAVTLVFAMGFISLFLITQGGTWHFVLAQGLIVVVLLLLLQLYIKAVKPLNTIGTGMGLLKEQDFSSRLAYVGQRDADKIVEIFNKMMSQLKEERLQLREQNHFLDLLINSSPMGVVILDIDEKTSLFNPIAREIMGLQDFDSSNILGVKIDDLPFQLAKELSKLEIRESRVVRVSDGNVYKCTRASFLDRGFNHIFYLIEIMTEELLRAEKKAYGQVIRMISHEVNNSMAGISSSIDTIQGFLPEIPEVKNDEDNIIEDMSELLTVASDRCINLSRFITRFADVVKVPEPQISLVSLNDFIRGRILFLESIASGKNIKLLLNLVDEDTAVEMDTILMEQAVLNIFKNAVESIVEGGIVEIESSVSPLSMTIIDDGKGISEEIEEKLFTPFFSTKPNGQGVGLLLVREILLKHGFRSSLATGDDGKTRFTILF